MFALGMVYGEVDNVNDTDYDELDIQFMLARVMYYLIG